MLKTISLRTTSRNQLVDITSQVETIVHESEVQNGICILYVPHTTAAITINENADPDVKHDILNKLAELVPRLNDYAHTEGNSDAHIKSSLIGCAQTVLISKGHLVLGTWQGCMFAEFDGPRNRKVHVKIISD
ncbi:YjbQ family protein [Candidatus Woesearchaeota archaeon]|nr:MAG: YjbQ family protein [Candidatus Woesearchaeota archaeon]